MGVSRTSLPNSTPLQLLLMSWGRGQLPPEPPVLGSKVEGSCFKEGEAGAEPCRVKDVNEAEDGWLEQPVQRPCGGEGCGNGQGKGVGGCGKGLRGRGHPAHFVNKRPFLLVHTETQAPQADLLLWPVRGDVVSAFLFWNSSFLLAGASGCRPTPL